MKIKTIKIQNFKSIADITIDCNEDINAFIGKNGAGKSNVFDAVNYLYDCYNDTNHKKNQENILLNFKKEVLKNKQQNCEIEIIFNDDKFIKLRYNNPYVGGQENFFITFDCDPFAFLYFEANRNIKKHEKELKYLYPQLGQTEYAKNNPMISDTTMLDGIVKGSQQGEQKLKNIITQGSDGQKQIAIFDIIKNLECYPITVFDNNLHYSIIKPIIFIDEPELHLHPHAKQNLYNILKELADKKEVQIFYITHSSEFLSYNKSQQITRFYLDNNGNTQFKQATQVPETTPLDKDFCRNKIDFNNAFFADKIFLVEGFSDYLFLKYVIKNKTGQEPEYNNISIIDSNGKSKMASYYKMYDSLGIDCQVLYDKDTTKSAKWKKSEQDKNTQENDVLSQLSGYVFDEDLETFLGYKCGKKEKTDAIIKWIKKDCNLKQTKIDEIWLNFDKL